MQHWAGSYQFCGPCWGVINLVCPSAYSAKLINDCVVKLDYQINFNQSFTH